MSLNCTRLHKVAQGRSPTPRPVYVVRAGSAQSTRGGYRGGTLCKSHKRRCTMHNVSKLVRVATLCAPPPPPTPTRHGSAGRLRRVARG